MEPGDRAAQEVSSRTRVRLLAVMFLLVGLAFIQDPGFLVADTKFDLAVSPGHFLQRALHLWDDEGAFGQLQNQAYGYLWPMGPFFVLLHSVNVPGWVAQRLWQALVMCVAFLGTARVTRALGIRTDLACVAAGLAFALSPRMLTVMGPISIEAWPSALAPWVLLPLVRGAAAGSTRRAAALSALAVATVGGVNAAATFAVLPVGAIWLLTRARGRRRTSLMLWWPVFTLLGTLWWLIPLFLMGHYSPPFLDYIETTTVTTFPTTVFDALRGTSNWVPYVSAESRAGNDLLITAYLALNSGIVLLLGFVGLLDKRNPHRLFLALSLLVGLLMVTAGHHGPVQGLFSNTVQGLLDGALAPLRNVHKFDPVIRLPLVVGMAFVVDRVVAARAAATRSPGDLEEQLIRFNQLTVLAMVMVGLAGSAIPALVGRIEPAGPVAGVPGYWEDASRWLARHDDGGTALLAPGSSFGSYLWGSPRDEPLQFLARSPWAVRNAIPLSPTGNIRMLDAVEDRFAQGKGSAGLAPYLRRNGVGYLVVRNDLRRGDDVPDPVLVHQALAGSPGVRQVASFGPLVGGGAHLSQDGIRTVINGGWQTRYPAVEVYAVAQTVAMSGGAPTVVAGGPEDLLDLQDLHVIGTEPVVLAKNAGDVRGLDPAATPYVLTDGLRKRERFFPRVHDAYSSVITPGDELLGLNPNRDYADPGDDRWATTARLDGARSISASSSGSDSDVQGGSRRGELPYAAVDSSRSTEWVSDPARDERTWWRIDFWDSHEVASVRLTGGDRADANQTVRVRTENGVSAKATAGPGESTTVNLPPGSTRWIEVESPNSSNRLLALADVSFGGPQVQRQLVLPRTPDSWGNPRAVVLRADLDFRRGCVVVEESVRCVQGKDQDSEEAAGAARRFTLAADGAYAPALVVRPRSGAPLEALITRQQPVDISASSTADPDPRNSALAAIDGDPATTWTADVADFRPTLNLNWIDERSITGLAISTSDDTAARRPRSLTLVWPGGRRKVTLDSRGRAAFPSIRTSQLRLQVNEAAFATNLGFDSQATQVGVGIQELRLTGLPYLPVALSTRPQTSPCGSGPTLRLNGVVHRTRVSATPAQLFTGESLPASICSSTATGPVASGSGSVQRLGLRAGSNDVTVTGSGAFDFDSLVLRDPAAAGTGTPVLPSTSVSDGPVRTILHPTAGASLVNLGQNQNPGWTATQGGKELRGVVLNGWQQGWFVRSAADPVVASYAPDGIYRLGLGGGLVALLALVASVWLRRRRPDRDGAPLAAGSMSWGLALVVAVGSSALVAGWSGVLVAGVVWVLATLLDNRASDVAPWLLAGCCLVAALGYFVHPWADPGGWAGDEAWPHYVALVPVVASVVLAARDRPGFFSLMRGASRKR